MKKAIHLISSCNSGTGILATRKKPTSKDCFAKQILKVKKIGRPVMEAPACLTLLTSSSYCHHGDNLTPKTIFINTIHLNGLVIRFHWRTILYQGGKQASTPGGEAWEKWKWVIWLVYTVSLREWQVVIEGKHCFVERRWREAGCWEKGGGKEKGSRREGREGQEYLIPFVTGWILQIIDAFTVRFHNSGNDSSQTICFH